MVSSQSARRSTCCGKRAKTNIHMRNRYGGACYLCGRFVAPGAGFFELIPGTSPPRWRVKHALHPGPGAVTCEMARGGDGNAASDRARDCDRGCDRGSDGPVDMADAVTRP